MRKAPADCAPEMRVAASGKSPIRRNAFAVAIGKPGPGAAEVLRSEEGRVVIRPNVLDVFNDENAFAAGS